MKNSSVLDSIISIKQNTKYPYIYDVELSKLQELKKFRMVECNLVIYPYSREITSDHISLNPFEEYVSDVLSSQSSAYSKITRNFKVFFGILLGILITSIFWVLNPENILTIESIVSILGAYFIGKEIWGDIEKFLMNISKRLPIKYVEEGYRFKLERNTTLTRYSYLAKHRRYGIATILPSMIDYIQQSNSQTVKLKFNRTDIRNLENDSAHILSIHAVPELNHELEEKGYLFGLKLSLSRGFCGFRIINEYFQSLDQEKLGCLNMKNQWKENSVFYRRTIQWGRIKVYLTKGIKDNIRMISGGENQREV